MHHPMENAIMFRITREKAGVQGLDCRNQITCVTHPRVMLTFRSRTPGSQRAEGTP